MSASLAPADFIQAIAVLALLNVSMVVNDFDTRQKSVVSGLSCGSIAAS